VADDPIDRRTQLFQTLTSLGVNPHVALGAMTSLAGESSVNFDPKSLGDATIPGGSVGIGQWNQDRRTALLNYAQSQGTSPNDFGTQLGYLKQELTNPNLPTYQPGVLNSLQNATSTAQGTKIWTGQFERPKVDNSAQRMQLTSQVGSVDDQGNFTPGGGRAPARPVTPSPGAAAAPPGTTLNTSAPVATAAGALGTPGGPALPGFGQSQSNQFLQGASGLEKAMGGQGLQGQQGGDGGQDPMRPSPMLQGPAPHIPNAQAAAQTFGQTLNSMRTPLQWGSGTPGSPIDATAGPQLAAGMPQGMTAQELQQMQQLQMMQMMGGGMGTSLSSPYGGGYG
jgi:hypothetical protein